MALGDLVASRFSHSSAVSSDHHCGNDGGFQSHPSEEQVLVSGSGNNDVEAIRLVYLHPAVLPCELRHNSFEDYVPAGAGPSGTGLVSKWRIKDRVCALVSFWSVVLIVLRIC